MPFRLCSPIVHEGRGLCPPSRSFIVCQCGLLSRGLQCFHPVQVAVYRSSFRPMLHTMTGANTRALMKILVDMETDKVSLLPSRPPSSSSPLFLPPFHSTSHCRVSPAVTVSVCPPATQPQPTIT